MTYQRLLVLLKERRMERGLSLSELGRELKVAPSTMSLRESGDREPNFADLAAWCQQLGVEIEALNDEEAAMIQDLRRLPDDVRASLRATITTIVGRLPPKES